MNAALLVLSAVIGIVAGWQLTVPVHRYKELRPLTPRDVAAEVGTADQPPPVIRAEYRQARCPHCHHVYRAADGGFVFGSREFRTDAARRETQDSERALFGLQVTVDENAKSVQAAMTYLNGNH